MEVSNTAVLPSQRHLFELPNDIAYFDGAAYSPLPRTVRAAGELGILSKSQPWVYAREENKAWATRARAGAAKLIGAQATDIALVGSVAAAMATAAANLPLPPGTRVLRIENEFPSVCLIWDRMAAQNGAQIDVVSRPEDGDWTAAILEAIERPGAPRLSVATLTPSQWADGSRIELDRIAPAVHRAGAALVIDATQAVGVAELDVAHLQPDFLAFPTYKWLLGPYSMAFLYAAKTRQRGIPMEEHADNRASAPGAAGYDRGEPNDPVGLRMAATGIELLLHWERSSVAAALRQHIDRIAAAVESLAWPVLPPEQRTPNVIGLRPPRGTPAHFVAELRKRGVVVSDRLGVLRISPHVWVNHADVDRLIAGLAEIDSALRLAS